MVIDCPTRGDQAPWRRPSKRAQAKRLRRPQKRFESPRAQAHTPEGALPRAEPPSKTAAHHPNNMHQNCGYEPLPPETPFRSVYEYCFLYYKIILLRVVRNFLKLFWNCFLVENFRCTFSRTDGSLALPQPEGACAAPTKGCLRCPNQRVVSGGRI